MNITSPWITTAYPIAATSQHLTETTSATLPVSTIRYDPVTLPLVLTERYVEEKRWYAHQVSPDQPAVLYPSITTMISATDTEGRAALKKWRQAVGYTASARISSTAAASGTMWHNFCEAYVTGAPVWPFLPTPDDIPMATAIATLLNQQLDAVLLSEARVVSTTYGIAGRLDLCVQLKDGRLAVLDFKTGKKSKTGNRLQNYGIQAAFYAEALSEWLGRGPIETLIIAQLSPTQLLWQESSVSLWTSALQSRVDQFATYVNTQLA